jgi:heme-degrading monooxygenase HmoA
MFVQVVRGKVKDADAMRAVGDRWTKEVMPTAKGFLGSTGGVADDGTAVIVTRWESEAAAQANSDRPEQGAWFAEASKVFDGQPAFYNCPDVDLMAGGGSNDAGFVQIMIYKPKDLGPVKEMSKQFERFSDVRPDLIGATTAYATDGTVIDTNYFTSEAEAREGEKKEMPAEVQELMKGFESNVGEVTFVDLKSPEFR